MVAARVLRPDAAAEVGGVTAPDAGRLWEALQDVMDPEIPVSLVDLGMIYGVGVEGTTARVTMTFTAVGCPCMEWIEEDIRRRLLQVPGIDRVAIDLVWDPPWTADRLSEKAKNAMREWGIQS